MSNKRKRILILIIIGALLTACAGLAKYSIDNAETVYWSETFDNSTSHVTDKALHQTIEASVKVSVLVDGIGLGSGSGTLIADNHGNLFAVTCQHVVNVNYGKREVFIHLGPFRLPATVLIEDAKTDVALLKVRTKGMSYKTVSHFAGSYEVSAGDACYAIGYPQGIGPVISQGIIGKIMHTFVDWNGTFTSAIISDTDIDHGNSGGGLFVTKNGQLYFAGMSRYGGEIQGMYGFVDMATVRYILDRHGYSYLLE